MGKRIQGDDYAKPIFTRLYRADRQNLDELVESFPPVPLKDPRKGMPDTREISESEVVRISIKSLHKQRVLRKKKAV
jgi:hypothetical protein